MNSSQSLVSHCSALFGTRCPCMKPIKPDPDDLVKHWNRQLRVWEVETECCKGGPIFCVYILFVGFNGQAIATCVLV